jgi:hypothetical protein
VPTIRALLIALPLALATASAASADGEAGFSLRPTSPEPGRPATQAYFIHELAAGGTASDELLVLNSGVTELTLDLYGVDAVTGATTGAVYTNRGAAPSGAGAWLRLPVARLMVPPRSTARVPFEVRAPADARAGQYLGGIAAQPVGGGVAAPVEPSAGARRGQFTLTTETRAVVAVAVTVPGPLERRLSTTEVRVLAGPGGARLAVGVRNDGNVLLKPRGELVLRDAADGEPGALRARLPLEMDTILPGGAAELTVPWPKELPAGPYRAEVALETSDALPAATAASAGAAAPTPMRVEGTTQLLTVAPPAPEASQSGVVNAPGTVRVVRGDAASWPWWTPYAAALVAVVVAGNVALALVLLRRRR